MYKFKFLIFIFVFFFYYFNLNANILIKYKIGNELITNFDIDNEKKYLLFLRPSLKNLSESEITKISENSLIREIIKKKEVDKIFKDIKSSRFIDELKKSLFRFKGVENENEFLKILKKNNIDYKIILEKMKYEGLWNELVLQRYNSLVKIDKLKLKQKLLIKISNEKKYKYNLSELIFDVSNTEKFENKNKEIRNFIKTNNFKSAAIKYSISSSANKGGEIGWVKQTLLSEDLIKYLNNKEIGSTTEAIKYPNGYLILKINDKKEMKNTIDVDQELEELVKFEKNKQLNQFSLLLFKKLKKNTIINEY